MWPPQSFSGGGGGGGGGSSPVIFQTHGLFHDTIRSVWRSVVWIVTFFSFYLKVPPPSIYLYPSFFPLSIYIPLSILLLSLNHLFFISRFICLCPSIHSLLTTSLPPFLRPSLHVLTRSRVPKLRSTYYHRVFKGSSGVCCYH